MRRRRLDEAKFRLQTFGHLVYTPAKLAEARMLGLRRCLKLHLAKVRAARRLRGAGRRVLALVAEAAAERARRGGRVAAAARTNTVVHTVRSRLQAAAPKRRRAAPRPLRRPALVVAAALGPVAADVVQRYALRGYG